MNARLLTCSPFVEDSDMTQVHSIQNDHLMFVTTNTLERKKVFAQDQYARECIEGLYRVQELHPFFLYGFVVMPDHAHMLLFVPRPEKISTIVKQWKMGISFSLGLGPIWQPRYDLRILEDGYGQVMEYIHMNPVKKGFCTYPEDYPWSSACGKWDVSTLDV